QAVRVALADAHLALPVALRAVEAHSLVKRSTNQAALRAAQGVRRAKLRLMSLRHTIRLRRQQMAKRRSQPWPPTKTSPSNGQRSDLKKKALSQTEINRPQPLKKMARNLPRCF